MGKQPVAVEPEAKEQMKQVGKRLAYLVYLAPITDDAKAEILQTVPFLSFAQIDELIRMLEGAISLTSGDPAKDEFFAKLSHITDAYEKERTAIDAKALKELKNIEQELTPSP